MSGTTIPSYWLPAHECGIGDSADLSFHSICTLADHGNSLPMNNSKIRPGKPNAIKVDLPQFIQILIRRGAALSDFRTARVFLEEPLFRTCAPNPMAGQSTQSSDTL